MTCFRMRLALCEGVLNYLTASNPRQYHVFPVLHLLALQDKLKMCGPRRGENTGLVLRSVERSS